MKLTDLDSYDIVILYGMGFNGKSVLNRIRSLVPNIICWDRNQGEYSGYMVTKPPIDFSFLANAGKYIIIITCNYWNTLVTRNLPWIGLVGRERFLFV